MESQAKLNEKCIFWYIIFQVLKLLLIKKCKIELVNQFLYFLLFYITSAFIFADIIFYNFLEPYLSFSEKDFYYKFSFFNRFTQTPKPFHSQNLPAKHDESYLLRLPKFGKFMVLYLGCGCMTF